MNKLKTLKDFEDYKMPEIDKQIIKAIKAEAVKWVKEWDKGINGQAVQDFIKHFFNLTEEDLK